MNAGFLRQLFEQTFETVLVDRVVLHAFGLLRDLCDQPLQLLRRLLVFDQVRSASLPSLRGGRDLECQRGLDVVITTAIGIYANRRRLAAAGLCVMSLIAGSGTTDGKARHWKRGIVSSRRSPIRDRWRRCYRRHPGRRADAGGYSHGAGRAGSPRRGLAAAGMTLRTPDGTFRTAVTAASRAEQVRLTDRDVLVFATKTQQLDAALQEWVDQPIHGPRGVVGTAAERLPVMTALNGVAAEEKALRYFRRVFGICVWLPAVHLEPGEVIVRSWPVVGQFHIARWPASLNTRADADLLTGWPRRGAPRESVCVFPMTSRPGSTTS